MTEARPSTRDRLILASVSLFQAQGYHGTSVADILALAEVPKGSLYHHFPNGKADLALAAAYKTSELMTDIVARAFDPAADVHEGIARLSEKLARLFERHPHWRACPVQSLLLDGPLPRQEGQQILQEWIDATAAQIARFGGPDPQHAAQRLWSVIIGNWTLARMAADAAPLRNVPDLLALSPDTGDQDGR